MPQFAVIASPFRRLSLSEAEAGGRVIRMNFEKRKTTRCLFEKPKAYLVNAVDSDAAMSLVQRFARSAEIELVVHRAVEVCETLPGTVELATRSAKGGA